MGLGGYLELWRSVEKHPAYGFYWGRLTALGRDPDEPRIRYYLTRNLLSDVAHAADGIEFTFAKIELAVSNTQRWVDQEVPAWDPTKPWPEGGHAIGHPEVDAAWFEFMNLVNWVKAFDERLAHTFGPHRLGLVNSLADDHPIAMPIRTSYQRLRKDVLADAHFLAEYATHYSAIPYPGRGGELTPDGKVIIKLPDPVSERILTWDQFTWKNNRDMISFGRHLLKSVETFMIGLIALFEEAKRQGEIEREQSQDGGSSPEPAPEAQPT
jgi:hypothetical protein